MLKLRFKFTKTGRAKYLSHLDLMRSFQRVFIRAGVDLKHSEGFNPHPRISIVLPLPLGCESVCEYLDAEVLNPSPDMIDKLNAVMPEGIEILSVHEPVMKPGAVKYTLCEIALSSDSDLTKQAEKRLCEEKLEIIKKTKRGEGVLNIAPHIKLLSAENNRFTLILSAYEPTVNPFDVLTAMGETLTAEGAVCKRMEIYAENMEKFQ